MSFLIQSPRGLTDGVGGDMVFNGLRCVVDLRIALFTIMIGIYITVYGYSRHGG
jgi:hypothetical protein